MTAACPSNGSVPRIICAGCRVPGFGAHECSRGRMLFKANGQSTFTKCECAVYQTCYSYADAALAVPGIPIPNYVVPPDNVARLAEALA